MLTAEEFQRRYHDYQTPHLALAEAEARPLLIEVDSVVVIGPIFGMYGLMLRSAAELIVPELVQS